MADAKADLPLSQIRTGDGRRPDFAHAKRLLVTACASIVVGLGVAGSIDRASGGVILLAGWLMGIVAIHRLGRSGSDAGPRTAERPGSPNLD